ncbi:unnamed protein product [Spirodela intermedia]|uniref:LisH domain-containing protein n=1 Tax=Spirodela intermedia TaxID=51605 RepID=A0A7I8IBG5_SPIIN|nr:unnamed protein product [Spirodela intermedia]CAA6655075.1 unnamed protein product [Spirodela intermedia]
MGKQQSPPKKVSLGKGKVTPVQIAFIVNRYLAENNFSTTLAAFQSEAAELFAKTRAREAPKGLLSLADILDEEAAGRGSAAGINGAMHAYHCATSGVHTPASPPLPSFPMSPVPPPTPGGVAVSTGLTVPTNRSLPGLIVQTALSRSSPSPIPRNIKQPSAFPSEAADPSCGSKRKIPRTNLQASAPSKKQRGQSQSVVSPVQCFPGGREETTHNLPLSRVVSPNNQNTNSSMQVSAVTNGLLTQLPDSNACSTSPKSHLQASSSQADKMGSSANASLTHLSNASTSRQLTPSKCSVISSKTIVVSPFKSQGYITVEKSFCISSPMKSSPQKVCRRDRVKGRLDFDDSVTSTCSGLPTTAETCTTSSEDGMKDLLDLDLPDFDIDFNFADLLVNIDLECEEFASLVIQHSCRHLMPPQGIPPRVDSLLLSEGECAGVHVEMGRDSAGPFSSSVTGVISERDINSDRRMSLSDPFQPINQSRFQDELAYLGRPTSDK